MNEEDFYKEQCRRKLKEMRRNNLNGSVSNVSFRAEPSSERLREDQIRICIERIQYCLKYNQYDRFISLIQQVNLPILLRILPCIPFDCLYESIPETLSALDVVFSQLLLAPSIDKSLKHWLQFDLLISKLILIFANGLRLSAKKEKNCNSYFPTCRSLLFAVFALDPTLPTLLNSGQDRVKSCIDQLAGHSLVECTNSPLTSLPDALQTELTTTIQQKKQTLQKLNDFCGKMAPTILSEVGHQRLLKVSEEEVENRIFQNVSLLAIIEPTLKDEAIQNLTKELQRRIESDKTLLRTYKSLEKAVGPSEQSGKEAVTVTLHKFLLGYRTALELLEEKKYRNSLRTENNQNRLSGAESPSTGIQFPNGNTSQRTSASDITDPFVTTAGHFPFDDGITNIGDFGCSTASSSNTNGIDKPQHLTSSNHKEEEKEESYSRSRSYSTPSSETYIAGSVNNTPRKTQENKSKAVNYFIAAGRRVSKNYSRDRRRKRSTLDDLEELISPERNVGGNRMSICDSFEESVTCSSSSQVDSASGSGIESADRELLLQELQNMRIELEHSREMICKLQAKEHQLRDRLSEQAHKQFTITNSHFEDLSLNDKRPTELIRLYGNLYSEARVDAADDLDNLSEISEYDKLKTKILFSVVVLAFRSTYESLLELKSKVRNLLHIQVGDINNENADLPSLSLEGEIDDYIRKTIDRHDCSPNVEDVCSKLYMALFDYPCLRQSKGLRQYIEECVRVSWALNVQNPRYIISYDSTSFDPQLHTRFHSSEPLDEEILEFLWPALLEENGACVYKAVVIT